MWKPQILIIICRIDCQISILNACNEFHAFGGNLRAEYRLHILDETDQIERLVDQTERALLKLTQVE